MITTTQYWLMRAGLMFMFVVSGYAMGAGLTLTFIRNPVYILLAIAGAGAYIFFFRLNDRLSVVWQKQQIKRAVNEAWTKALDDLRARGDIK